MFRKFTPVLFLLAACAAKGPPAIGGGAPEPEPNFASGGEPSFPSVTPVSPTGNPDLGPGSPDLQPAARHTRCGWIGAGETAGEASFIANAHRFNTVHPKWYMLAADAVGIRKLIGDMNPSIIAAAKANNVRLMPLIGADDGPLRTMMNDPIKRSGHVKNIVDLVVQNGLDGIDIDYEHLWQATDRPGFSAFMTELSTAMHAAGVELSMAGPGLAFDNKKHAYDYVLLSSIVDTIHVMGYDYHGISSPHMGPIAPKGWMDAAFKYYKALGKADHFMIGVANYAIAPWWFSTTKAALPKCTSTPEATTSHMSSCIYEQYEAGRAMHCNTAEQGEIWFEDVASMDEKIALAKSHGGRGVTYWTIGEELPGFFDMVQKHYP